MIRNNLAALMGERGLKITRVAKETGISRNTITSISQNDSDMIRMDTINTLCKYLGVTPCEFYEYEPVDIEFSVYISSFDCYLNTDFPFTDISFGKIEAEIILDVIKQNNKQSFDLTCSLVTTDKKIRTVDVPDKFVFYIDFEEDHDKETFLTDTYNKINAAFRQDIYNSLLNKVYKVISERAQEEISNSFHSLNDKHELEGLIKHHFYIDIESEVFKKF